MGALVIERRIVENLFGRLGLELRQKEKWTIVEYVEEAKKTVEP